MDKENNQNKKGGRKPLPEEKKRRNHPKLLNFNDDEWNKVNQNANNSGLNLSEFIRLSALQDSSLLNTSPKLRPVLEKRLIIILNGLANNTNQIARQLNAGQAISSNEILDNQHKLLSLLNKILDQLL